MWEKEETMQLRFKKVLAFICALAMVLTAQPLPAKAAATPQFKKTYDTLFENGDQGFTYTITGVKKGQSVAWSVTGEGARYIKLNKTSAKITGKQTKNKVVVVTNEELAAKNLVVNVIAKIYGKNGKLKYTLSGGNARIGIRPTKLEIVATDVPSTLQVGSSYIFRYQITPKNSTASVVWDATYEDGTDASDCITNAGKFTPKKNGLYTLTVKGYIGEKLHASAQKTVSVDMPIISIRQTAVDKILIVYPEDVSKTLRKESFTLKNFYGVAEPIKDLSFSTDGKEVTLITSNYLRSGETYTLTDGRTSREIAINFGAPVDLKVLTTEAVVGKLTPIQYALYDANGIDVTELYRSRGTISFYPDLVTAGGGYITPENEILLTSVGTVSTFTAIFFFNNTLLTTQGTVICVPAPYAAETNFTLSRYAATPNYTLPTYRDNRTAVAGSTYYLHFRALDTDRTAFQYVSVTYESSNPDILLVYNAPNGTASATAIRDGIVTVTATANYGGQTYTYSYKVEVEPKPLLASISLDTNYVYLSDKYPENYRKYINVTAYNQFGQSFELTNEYAFITEFDSAAATGLIDYDPIYNRLVIAPGGQEPGQHRFTLSLTCDGRTASTDIYVYIQTPPASGGLHWQAEIDQPVVDLTPNEETNLGDYARSRDITIRLEETRSSIFSQYHTIQKAYISKDGQYYYSDLTKDPTASRFPISVNSSSLAIQTVALTGNICKKAPAGIYYVELEFAPTGTSADTYTSRVTASFEIKDSQGIPTVTVARTTASMFCPTALALAQNCLAPSDGAIVACTVLGSNLPGSTYSLTAGQPVHIQTVTVRVQTLLANNQILYYDTVVDVGKTLTNR